jgi:hypothetical protein
MEEYSIEKLFMTISYPYHRVHSSQLENFSFEEAGSGAHLRQEKL